MTPAERLLAEIRAIAKDEHDKGTRFERLMLHALQTDRTFLQQFTQVWMWMDSPDRVNALRMRQRVIVENDSALVDCQSV